MLEKKLQKFTEQKSDFQTKINEFNQSYHSHFRAVINAILAIRVEIFSFHQNAKQAMFEKEKATYNDHKSTVDDLKAPLAKLEQTLKDTDEFSDEYEELYEQYQSLKARNHSA
jgi:tRNA C32,U32 (ribose-2'-O)-methylase TrmJ